MVFTKGTEYALKAMAFMGKHPDQKYFGVKEIAESLNVSPSYLAKILQKLARDGYLRSITGPGGGFGLAPEPDKIRLISILESMDDSEFLTRCVLGWSECGDNNPCPFHRKWKAFRDELNIDLERVSIEEISDLFWPDYNSPAGKKGSRSGSKSSVPGNAGVQKKAGAVGVRKKR